MNIQNVIGELLYIGIVAEKGRCYGTRWKLGYKKVLRTHIVELNELQKCLQKNDEKEAKIVVEKFITTCDANYEIGKFYNFSSKQIEKMYVGKSSIIVNQLMDKIFVDLITEIKKPYIQKKKVYDLLCVLHNLPRVYLGKNKETLCELNQETISEQDALAYAFDNMSLEMKRKYRNIPTQN